MDKNEKDQGGVQELQELHTIAALETALSTVRTPLNLQPYIPTPVVRPPTPDRSIEAQMKAFQDADKSMTESERKRARTETPPLPGQCQRPAENMHGCFALPVLATDLPHRRSIYVGVNWDQRWEKWKARIMVDSKMRHLGYFDEEADAAKKYDEHASTSPGKPVNFPKVGQIQAVKKNAVVTRTDLESSERLQGHEWLTNGLLGRYDYSEASRHVDKTQPTTVDIACGYTLGYTPPNNASIPRDPIVEARYVAQLIEGIIFQARQDKNLYFEKIHQVSADLTGNPQIRYAAVKLELTPAKIVSMDTEALLTFKRKAKSSNMAVPKWPSSRQQTQDTQEAPYSKRY